MLDEKDLELLKLKIEKEITASPDTPLAKLTTSLLDDYEVNLEKLSEYYEHINAYDFILLWAKSTELRSSKYVGKEDRVKFIFKKPKWYQLPTKLIVLKRDDGKWYVRVKRCAHLDAALSLGLYKILKEIKKNNHLRIKKKEIL